MRCVFARYLSLFLLLIHAPLASAQNLIPFANFDMSSDLVDGWGNLGAGKVWSSVDVDGSPSSGSLLLINDKAALTGILVFSGCVNVNPGQTYDFGAWYFMQIFQPGSGSAQVQVNWYDLCGGSFVGNTEMETSTTEGVWVQIVGQAVAPNNASGARLQLINAKSSGNPGEEREIFFDAVFLPEPGGAAAGLTAVLSLALVQRRTRWRASNRNRPPSGAATS